MSSIALSDTGECRTINTFYCCIMGRAGHILFVAHAASHFTVVFLCLSHLSQCLVVDVGGRTMVGERRGEWGSDMGEYENNI